MTADLAALAGVIGLSFATSFGTELLQYLLVYRTSNFKTLKANIEKHAAKVEEAKDGSSASSAKAVKKREARLQGWEQEAGKQITAVNFKCGAIAMIALVLTWRFIPKLFGGIVVLRLPFEPPGFFQKATHRGLEGADVRDASAIFVYMLCQACFRAILGKILPWGPSRRMAQVKPFVPKAFKVE